MGHVFKGGEAAGKKCTGPTSGIKVHTDSGMNDFKVQQTDLQQKAEDRTDTTGQQTHFLLNDRDDDFVAVRTGHLDRIFAQV